MKNIFCMFIFSCLLATNALAQDVKQGSADGAMPAVNGQVLKPILHQLYLPKQAIKVGVIRYKDGEVLDGELSPDGLRLMLKNYTRKGTVEVTLLFKDGTEETIQRTSCVIDMVPTL